MTETEVGVVLQYFAKISVAAVNITAGTLKVGDRIHILGHTTDLTQTVDSIQLEHEKIQEAKTGQSAGIKVLDRVRPHDKIYKMEG